MTSRRLLGLFPGLVYTKDMFIDSHCHLFLKPLSQNLNRVIDQAQKAGIKKIIIPATDLADFNWIKSHINRPGLYFCLGIHPSQIKAKLKWPEVAQEIQKIKSAYPNKIVAIGEIGLDSQVNTSLNRQISWLERQVQLAEKLHLPIVIHNRGCQAHFQKLILSHKMDKPGVFHSFIGKPAWLSFILKHGFYIGLSGLATYSSFNPKNWLIIKSNLDRIIFETDAPFLLPSQLKSSQTFNQPANVKIIAEFIASKLNGNIKFINQTSSQNALKLFNLQ